MRSGRTLKPMTVAFDTIARRDVALGDAADAAQHEREPHFVVLLVELVQRLGDRFERTLHVGLQDEVQRGDLAPLHHREDVFEPGTAAERHRVRQVRGVPAAGARLGDRARGLVGRRDAQLVARERDVVETEHLDRHRRTGLGDLGAVLVEHRPHPAPRRTGDDRVADVQRAFHHQRGHDRTPTGVEVRLEHRGPGEALRVGDELVGDLDVGDEQDRVEQLVDAQPDRRGDVEHHRVAAPLLGHQTLLGELLAHTRWDRRLRGRTS